MVKVSLKVYAALQAEFPGEKNAAIGRHIDAGNGVISKLGRGAGIGLKEARWLAKHDSKWIPLCIEAEEAKKIHNESVHVKINKARSKKKAPLQEGIMRGVKLSALPRHLQSFVGFVS